MSVSTLQRRPQAQARPSAASAGPSDIGGLDLGGLLDRAARVHAQGGAAAAVGVYEVWLRESRSPMRHVAAFNYGVLLGELQRPDAAMAAYQQALALKPDFAPALLNIGHALERAGQPEAALASWQRVIDASDTALEMRLHGLNNSARLLEVLRRYPESEAQMQRSLLLQATQPSVIQHYVHVRQKQCAWPWYQPLGRVTPNQLLMGTSALAMMSVTDDPALQLLAAQRHVCERVAKPQGPALHTLVPRQEGRIRIGYLSGDLHTHAVGMLTAELFELHDRSRFEVWAFDWTPDSAHPLRQRLKAAFDHHVPIGALTDAQASQVIAQCGIDVLIDLQGLTSGARPDILVNRPAPVQVSYLGLPGTSAIPGVDWMLADAHVMPPELLPYCTEKPIYVPRCYQVSDRQRDVGPTPTRAACGLPETGTVFASFNNTFKFSEEMFDAWMRILAGVDGSVLWLLADNDTARANMQDRARLRGIDAARLHFAPRVTPADYLARFKLVDLMLDTFPYNAGTTASDALWMGTPMVTRSGRTYISRMAGSLLTAAGLPELVTDNLADYERLAIQLGRNPLRLVHLRRYLAEEGRAAALFDVPGLVRDIEDAIAPLALDARAQARPA